MFLSPYAVSSGAHHVIQLFFVLSIQLLFLLSSFVYETASQSNPKKKRAVIYFFFFCTVFWNATIQRNAKQCNSMAQPIEKRYAMFCFCLRCPSYSSLHGVLERYNTMQCNAMQSNGTAEREKKTLCHAPVIAYDVLGRSPCC